MASRKAMIRTAKILSCLFQKNAEDIEIVHDHVPYDDDENIATNELLSEKLNSLIKRSASTRSRNMPEVFLTIEKEFNLYEATGEHTPNLGLLHNGLVYIKSTTAEAERTFSAVGLFITKLRCQLSD